MPWRVKGIINCKLENESSGIMSFLFHHPKAYYKFPMPSVLIHTIAQLLGAPSGHFLFLGIFYRTVFINFYPHFSVNGMWGCCLVHYTSLTAFCPKNRVCLKKSWLLCSISLIPKTRPKLPLSSSTSLWEHTAYKNKHPEIQNLAKINT